MTGASSAGCALAASAGPGCAAPASERSGWAATASAGGGCAGSAEAASAAASAGGTGAAVSMLGSALASLGSSAAGDLGAADVTWRAAPSLACTDCRPVVRAHLLIYLLHMRDVRPTGSLNHPSAEISTMSDVAVLGGARRHLQRLLGWSRLCSRLLRDNWHILRLRRCSGPRQCCSVCSLALIRSLQRGCSSSLFWPCRDVQLLVQSSFLLFMVCRMD